MSRLTALAATFLLSLTACTTEDEAIAGLAGAALGAITAEALLEDDDWALVGALGGAAAGVLVARDRNADRCAYATGDGTYIVRRC